MHVEAGCASMELRELWYLQLLTEIEACHM